MKYLHFIPLVHFGPISGTTFTQKLPLNSITNLILGKNIVLKVERNIFCDRKIIFSETKNLAYNQRRWVNKEAARFSWTSDLDDEKLCYIETHIEVVEGDGFSSSELPPFYVFYTSNTGKTYLSCGNQKYGNPRVIMQMTDFGVWVEGYPAVNIDKNINSSYSILIINPYSRTNEIQIMIGDLKINYSVTIKARSVKRVDVSELIKINKWSGQVYIQGTYRAIIYLANHVYKDFSQIITIEHGDPFRAELNFQPRLQRIRAKLHNLLVNYV